MFDTEWIGAIVDAARRSGIDPAGLLAVVEVESSGRPYEADGLTPRFLFERHLFHQELQARAPAKLAGAVGQNLAYPRARKGQYADQGNSAAKLALLARARAVDLACADRACSWGVGQVLGRNAESLGFRDVGAMMAALRGGGVAAQIDLMVRFITGNGLVRALNTGAWPAFARRYNGPNYAQNRYDAKLADAHLKWSRYLAALGSAPPPAPAASGPLGPGSRGERVRHLQVALGGRGYAVGAADGLYGARTGAAVAAFQRACGLPETGVADEGTLLALAVEGRPHPPPVPPVTGPVVQAPPVLSWIDTLLGGEGLAGSKTALAVVAYALLSILQATDVVGTATGAPAPAPGPAAGSPARAAAVPGPLLTAPPPTDIVGPGVPAAAAPPAPSTTPAPIGTRTPTGQILTLLIGAFGALGLLGKFGRLTRLVGLIAASR